MRRIKFKIAFSILFSIILFSCFIASFIAQHETPKIDLQKVRGTSGTSKLVGDSSIPNLKWNSSIGISTLAMSADGAYVVAGSNRTIYLFHKSSPIPVWNYSIAVTKHITDVAISADGSYIVAGGDDCYVYLFCKNSSAPLWIFNAGGRVNRVAISADGYRIIAGTECPSAYQYFFHRDNSTPIEGNLGVYDANAYSLAISANGNRTAAAGETCYIAGEGWQPFLIGHNIERNLIYPPSAVPYYFGLKYMCPSGFPGFRESSLLAISADGHYLAVGGVKVTLFDLINVKTELWPPIPGPLWSYSIGRPVNWVSMAADGGYIVAGGKDDPTIYLFKKENSAPIWNYSAGGNVNSVVISADGNSIVAGCSDKQIYFFNRSILNPLWTHSMNAAIVEVALAANGMNFVVGTNSSLAYYELKTDNTPPKYSNEKVSPNSPQGCTPLQHFQFNLTIIDDLELDTVLFKWNGTRHPVISHIGSEYYFDLYGLGAGIYQYQWLFNDTSNNWNSTIVRIYEIMDNMLPKYTNEKVSPNSPQVYNPLQHFQFNLTITDNINVDTVLFKWNGIYYSVTLHIEDEFYFNLYDLGVGSYQYQWLFNDTSNNWNSTIEKTYIVNPNPEGLNILLNGTSDNYQIRWGTYCNITLTFPIHEDVTLYLNGSLITSQAAPLINVFPFDQIGIYNITAYHPESQNYMEKTLTRWLKVVDMEKPVPMNLCVNPIAPIYNQNQLYQFNCTWTDNVELDTVLFNFNGVNYTNIGHRGSEYFCTLVNLPANKNGYPYLWFANDTSGNWGVTPLNNYIINKKIPEIQLLLNSESKNYIINQWEYINISASLLEASNCGNFTIYINGSASASSSFMTHIESVLQFPAAGNYNITCAFSENQNLTLQRQMQWLVVRDIEPPQMIHFPNLTYLNCTAVQYQHSGLRIAIDVSDNVWVSYVFLCENSTGAFINRTMIKALGNLYLISLSIKGLKYGDHLAYRFYANDTSNNWQLQGNLADFFVLQIYDFIQPSPCNIEWGVVYAPNFVLPNSLFRISGGNDFGGSGVDFYQYKWDSGDWVNGAVGIYSGLQNGVHMLFYRAVDKAGNGGIEQNITIYFLAYEADYDNDNVTNFAEIFTYRTNPFKPDTDGDGLSDSAEIFYYQTNPNDPDTDSDGISDGEEINLGANPLNPANPLIGRLLLVIEMIFGIVLSGIIIKIEKSGPKRRQLKKILKKYRF